MKKVVIALLLIIPIIGVNTVNNKNYELETVTNTYTKEEIDSKLEEIRTSINNNKTSIEENKNILTTIQNKLNDYALKTALNEANSNIDNLIEIVNKNKEKIDELEEKLNIKLEHKLIEISSFERNSDNTAYLVNVGTGYKYVILEGWTKLNHYGYVGSSSDTGWGYRTLSTSDYSGAVLSYDSKTGIAMLNQFTGAGSIKDYPIKSGTLRFYCIK